jgi:pimeloyl-ACP methyl ester carboxylesterase
MGEGAQAHSRVRSAAAAVTRGVAALLLFILVLLAILRIAAAFRERGSQPPPGTIRFATPTGAMAARVQGPANGPVLLIVHGTAAWSGFWKDVSAHLAGRGWRVVAIDLPPFGWSDRDPAARYDRVAQAERLSAVAAAQQGPVTIVAHSFGAGAATELALRHPEQVRGLVLVDAALGELDPQRESGVARSLRVRPVAEAVSAVAITNPPALEPFLRSFLARKDAAKAWIPLLRQPMLRQGSTSAYADWLPNLFASQDGALSRRSDQLRAIKCPVALIWGAADHVTPLDQGRRLADMSHARSLTVLPGVGHIPHIEDPAGFDAALDRSLTMLEGSNR